LAASTQRLASAGRANAKAASRILGILVIAFSFGLGGAQLVGLAIDQFALPLGIILFAIVIGIRIWSRRPNLSRRRSTLPQQIRPHDLVFFNPVISSSSLWHSIVTEGPESD
jgi:hypothetical protein